MVTNKGMGIRLLLQHGKESVKDQFGEQAALLNTDKKNRAQAHSNDQARTQEGSRKGWDWESLFQKLLHFFLFT